MKTTATLLLLLVAAGAIPPPLSVSATTLKKLTDLSDGIFVGRVTRVFEAEAEIETEVSDSEWRKASWRFAELEVETVLRGAPATSRVHFLAQGTWLCDISTASVGEEALLFLEHLPLRGSREELDAETRDPVWRIAHSGRGRIPLRRTEGRRFATVDVDSVELPKSIPTQPGPVSDSDSVRDAPLDTVVSWCRKRIAKKALFAPAHPEHGTAAQYALYLATPDTGGPPRSPSLICAVWSDGDYVYSKNGVEGGAPYRRERVGTDALRRLSEQLDDASGGWKDLLKRFDDETLAGIPSYHLVVRDWETRELVRIPAGTTVRDRSWHKAVEALLALRPWFGERIGDFEIVLR